MEDNLKSDVISSLSVERIFQLKVLKETTSDMWFIPAQNTCSEIISHRSGGAERVQETECQGARK